MSLWDAIVLGVVQGATEFLPVSSSGHLVMAQEVLSVNATGIAFEIVVHLATLLSILLVYRTRVTEVGKGLVAGDPGAYRYVGLVAVATVPAALVGVLGRTSIERLFEDPMVPGLALIVTGVLLWSTRGVIERAHAVGPTWMGALIIGLAQAFALVPGISRSGATVVAALWLGIEAREAAAFSFMMAVPAIGGAAVLQALELEGVVGLGGAVLLGGSVAAAVTGVLAIRTFVAMLAKRSFHLFAPYCWVVAVAYLAFLALR